MTIVHVSPRKSNAEASEHLDRLPSLGWHLGIWSFGGTKGVYHRCELNPHTFHLQLQVDIPPATWITYHCGRFSNSSGNSATTGRQLAYSSLQKSPIKDALKD